MATCTQALKAYAWKRLSTLLFTVCQPQQTAANFPAGRGHTRQGVQSRKSNICEPLRRPRGAGGGETWLVEGDWGQEGCSSPLGLGQMQA